VDSNNSAPQEPSRLSSVTEREGLLVGVLGMRRSGVRALAGCVEALFSRSDHSGSAESAAPFVPMWAAHEAEMNERVLRLLGHAPDHVGWKWGTDLEEDSRIAALRREAVRRFQNGLAIRGDGVGLKDTRTCRLLGFWTPVFGELGWSVRFVVAVRNPATVATRMAEREGLAPERAYCLWLRSVLSSLDGTAGSPRILVDYDDLVTDPAAQIARIAAHLDRPEGSDLATADWPRSGRRRGAGRSHHERTLAQLESDRRAPAAAVSAYRLFRDIAAGRASLDDEAVSRELRRIGDEVDLMAPLLGYIDQQDDSRSRLLKSAAAASVRVSEAELLLTEWAHERRQHEIQAADRARHEAEHQAFETQRNEGRLLRLGRIARDRDAHIGALHHSNSWRATRPFRALSLLLRGRWSEPTTPLPPPVDAELDVARAWSPEGSAPPAGPSDARPAPSGPQGSARLRSRPVGFDPVLYIEMNPDLAAMPLQDTETHFLNHGHREGRRYLPPELRALAASAFRESRDTMLLVTHEASRTGAPILSLNLALSYEARFNVVVILLGGGALEEAFRRTGAVVLAVPEVKADPLAAAQLLRRLERRFSFKFALVNSIESRAVIAPLSHLEIPTVSLWHEFAAYTRPRGAFADAALWSTEAVFSTRLTRDNALAEERELARASFHVLPQGRCLVPRDPGAEAMEEESHALRLRIRPREDRPGTRLVLGAGWVHFRKGVDLFIQCAARIVALDPENAYRFIWVGGGVDPEGDLNYSAYLTDQIERAGLVGRFQFVDETPAIETAYEEADFLLLTSRLDPLPNVAIDAMAFGVPVLCFQGTTGIADFLLESGLGESCVAGYLDTEELASKLIALANSPALLAEVSGQTRRTSTLAFSFPGYVEALDGVVAAARRRTLQEKADAATILGSSSLRKDFASPRSARDESDEIAVRRYVRAWASGTQLRKPRPGFHPGVYLEAHGLQVAGSDPFADFIRAGEPSGPWLTEVITPGRAPELPGERNGKAALHIHVHYADLLPAVLARLHRNRTQPDLFVSITGESLRAAVAGPLQGYRGRVVAVEAVPNRGRDIGPLLTWMGRRDLSAYDSIGHVHTKRSRHMNDEAASDAWFNFLLEGLLGGEEGGAMADVILGAMRRDPGIGMVFPDDPHVVDWGMNRAVAGTWAPRLGIDVLPDHWNFPVGMMFWARRRALSPLFDLELDWEDYPDEPLPEDGTLLHALERMGVLTLPALGLRAVTTNVPGFTR
jgi:glycosyltransferase involved in cell wall biosynthesis